ncbi:MULTISPECIES: flavin reductase family protein [unclassified Streptococcus]|uniref:flavin reductase family protein n=1 Tax=unclassified Streptococcus TaxID=2608887 RepID=UPI0018A9C259|nr:MULTISPECIES: flavin reductase family protein [unclassified Streptococcus]MBF8970737.1 flavin reductase family protein [Streptococcus sp. NLN76]MBG9367542.1 flavin reductase family protein [Streptococcus sp. NLN64]
MDTASSFHIGDKNMIREVPLEKAHRILALSSVTFVSSATATDKNIMPAGWVGTVDTDILSLVMDSENYTRKVMEESGYFVLQIPRASQADLIVELAKSRHVHEEKVDQLSFFDPSGKGYPLLEDCLAWVVCEIIPEERNQTVYDLFLGRIVAAWADDSVFHDGRWHLDQVEPENRPVHYVAGGQFYQTGSGFQLRDPFK